MYFSLHNMYITFLQFEAISKYILHKLTACYVFKVLEVVGLVWRKRKFSDIFNREQTFCAKPLPQLSAMCCFSCSHHKTWSLQGRFDHHTRCIFPKLNTYRFFLNSINNNNNINNSAALSSSPLTRWYQWFTTCNSMIIGLIGVHKKNKDVVGAFVG